MNKKELRELFGKGDWNEKTIIEADKIVSRINLKSFHPSKC